MKHFISSHIQQGEEMEIHAYNQMNRCDMIVKNINMTLATAWEQCARQ